MIRFGLALLALGSLVAALWFSRVPLEPGAFPVLAVRVVGDLRRLTPERLEQAVGAELARGFFEADLGQIRRAAESIPWVKRVTVVRVWPGRIELRVQEREAAARWASGGLIDRDGDRFLPSEAEYPVDLPLLSGPEGSHGRVLERYREIHGWFAGTDYRIRSAATDARGAWQVELADGLKLVLGREPSAAGVRRFLRALPPVVVQWGAVIEQADLRYPNGFAIRWRPEESSEAPVGQGARPRHAASAR